MTKREAINGTPYAGNPHVRFDEGEAASTATSRRGSLLYKKLLMMIGAAAVAVGANADSSGDVKMPILGWHALPQDMSNARRYAEAKDAGFTHLTQWCKTPADAKRFLSEAEKAGIKLVIGFAAHSWENGLKRMTDEAEAFTAAVKDSPALGLYYITDEPHVREAEAIGECVKRYGALDPAHICYVNLFGAGGRLKRNTGCATYRDYLDRLYGVAPLKMLSFDVYPIRSFKSMANGDLRLHGARVFLKGGWYATLETASAFAREKRIPMYAFALATPHRHNPAHPYPHPTMGHLRLQMYSNLAYGAQMLQYFRYHMNCKDRAPIASGGKRSPVFELVREMNQEIQSRAYVFVGAEVQRVWHTGAEIPSGTKQLDKKALPPFVKSLSTGEDDTAVVSWLKNGEKEYLVVVNRDPNDDISFSAIFAPETEVVRRDGTRAKANAYMDRFWLEPGDAAIFTANKEQK